MFKKPNNYNSYEAVESELKRLYKDEKSEAYINFSYDNTAFICIGIRKQEKCEYVQVQGIKNFKLYIVENPDRSIDETFGKVQYIDTTLTRNILKYTKRTTKPLVPLVTSV